MRSPVRASILPDRRRRLPTIAVAHIRALTTAPRIKPTSIFLCSARRPNPGREAPLIDAEFLFRQPEPVQTHIKLIF